MAKKFLSALLAALMVISIVPMTAMASGTAENVPTLAVGVSNSQSDANTDIGKAVSGTVNITDAENAKNILWFAMTGLGTSQDYSLSMKNSAGKELLGEKYVDYSSDALKFTPSSVGYVIYVDLENAAPEGKREQVNKDNLADGKYTVTLTNLSSGKEVATASINLSHKTEKVEGNDVTTWSGTQVTDPSKIAFKVASAGNVDATPSHGKNLSDLQTGEPKFEVIAVDTNKWKVKVTGTELKYVKQWTDFSNEEDMQHGYYLGISIPKSVDGNIVSKLVVPKGKAAAGEYDKTAFTEYGNNYCDNIIYLGETSVEAKAKASYALKITYGHIPEQTYTFDFSGLTFPDETVKAEAATGNLLSDSKDVNGLQTDIKAETDEATKTVKVTGTSYYVKDWSGYSSNTEINDGNFVALKLTNKAGVPMHIYSPKKSTGTWIKLDDGVVIGRMQNIEADGYKVKVKVGANDPTKDSDGTLWTIDFSDVVRDVLTTDLKVDPQNGTVYGMKGTDLQSDITTSRTKKDGVTTIYVRGTSNYVTGYTGFSSDTTLREGNYVSLKLTADGTIKVGTKDYDKDCLVVRLNDKSTNGYKVENVTVAHGTNPVVTDKYTLDFSGVIRKPAEIKTAAVVKSGDGVPVLAGLGASYDKTTGKIALSGRVSPKTTNPNLFDDAELTVTYGTSGTQNVKIRFVKNGETLEPAADPATVAGNTLSFDTSMLVIKKDGSADKAGAGEATAKAAETIPEEQKKVAEEIATALAKSDTKIQETILQKYADVAANETAKKEDLIAEAAKIVADNDKVPQSLKANIEYAADGGAEAVTTFVQTYAAIEVVGVETNDKNEVTSFDLSITPMVRTIVSLTDNESQMRPFDPEATTNANANAIVVKDEEVAISEATTVKLALPASYKADKAYIIHTKDDGKVYNYTGKIEGSNPRTLSFTSEHGFSSFTITSTEPAKSKDATLKSVKVSGTEAVLSGTAYTATLPKDTDLTKLTLTVTPNSDMAKITVNGTAYTAGTSVDIDLSANKTVTIAVTAEDGTTKATYALTGKLAEDMPSDLYTDIPSGVMGDWVKDAINYGIMSSNVSGKYEFQPNATTPRRYFALMVARADIMAADATITDKEAADAKLMADYGTKEPDFTDTAKEDAKIKAAIAYCQEKGIMNGDAGKFNPAGIVNRMEAASILANWLELPEGGKENTHDFKDWDKIPDWAKGNINAVATDKIMEGHDTGNFGTENLSRVQTAVIMVKAFERLAGITE